MNQSVFDHEAIWWQSGVIYQIYPRSFMDTNADGIGDLEGIIRKLDYLNNGTDKSLGIDAIWLSPIYPSPMADFGYDVSDYCNIHSIFGNLQIFDRLITEAHQHNIKIILDFVPNHTSDQHPWFQFSRLNRDNQKREWYYWRDPKPDGAVPNNWGSAFGGSAWEWDVASSQYYLHSFLKEQPDLNWRNPQVKAAMIDTLRFWLDRGVDGFRMDVVGMILKDPNFRDNPLKQGNDEQPLPGNLYDQQIHLYDQDLDEVHEVIKSFRTLLNEYTARCGIGEVWYEFPRWVKYYGDDADELHLPFNFRLMNLPWKAKSIQKSVEEMELALPNFAWPNYVLNSHDAPRLISRIGHPQARIAAMLLLTLRGTPTLYFGEELGMENGEITPDQMQDPQGIRLGLSHSRDFSRTPMQWTGGTYAGFSDHKPWLPVNSHFKEQNVETENHDSKSMLNLYRQLIHFRKNHIQLQSGAFTSIPVNAEDCFVYERYCSNNERLIIALNFSSQSQHLTIPGIIGGKILLSTFLDRSESIKTTGLDLRGDEGVIIEDKSNSVRKQEN